MLVEIGGDLRAAGEPAEPWVITVAERAGEPGVLVTLAHGGLTTFLLSTHVVAVISDSYVAISPTVLVWPFDSGYRPFAMAVGTLALYGLVLAAVVGAARGRLATSEAFTKHWRTIHIAASVGWLMSIGHALLAGTDRGTPWMLAITIGCLTAVAAAGVYRVRSHAARTSTALSLARAGRVR